ncbi:hypothetical protein ZOSMA_129G00330 [Zostera marina]|uniref:Uncharacterized protein n=1 Tax=Zostera marina TaxID=29655 RepID=A0A0K9Q1V3_ZOSMR|nr:hypothetical protein ZOSMA_129G00330 [Zostera marina]
MDVKGNTFVFGLILLEIISGRSPFCKDMVTSSIGQESISRNQT